MSVSYTHLRLIRFLAHPTLFYHHYCCTLNYKMCIRDRLWLPWAMGLFSWSIKTALIRVDPNLSLIHIQMCIRDRPTTVPPTSLPHQNSIPPKCKSAIFIFVLRALKTINPFPSLIQRFLLNIQGIILHREAVSYTHLTRPIILNKQVLVQRKPEKENDSLYIHSQLELCLLYTSRCV